ncbi:Endonuclease/exonuclease/phosphatase, partial [Cladochytrium replicatum]
MSASDHDPEVARLNFCDNDCTVVPPATSTVPATTATATVVTATSASATATATAQPIVKISEIQGNTWRSPKLGKTVTNVRGIMIGTYVTSIYIQDPEADGDSLTSEGILAFSGTSSFANVFGSFKVGDLIQIGSAVVSEFRSSSAPFTNTLTQLTTVRNVTLLQARPADKVVTDLISPKELGQLDMPNVITWDGNEFAIGAPQINLDNITAPLTPTARGTDFFEALEFMLVKVPRPVAISKTDANGNFWVLANRGELATSRNARGGVTVNSENGVIDSNPERIQIVPPSVGDTTSPSTISIGDELDDIVGVLDFAFDKWRVIPLANVKITKSRLSEEYPATRLEKTDCGLVVSNYNMLNLDPSDTEQVKTIAKQIAEKLKSPDIIGAQEIQDNNGETNNGIVDADQTLNLLVDSIVAAGGVKYSWVQINPTNGLEGGAPGGNIRVAYLYNPLRVSLTAGTIGGTNDTQEVSAGPDGKAVLKYAAGRIDPQNPAWEATRRSAVASFEFRNQKFFLINNHWSSKGGSTPTYGHLQPATNGVVDKRIAQANVVRAFIDKILAIEPTAKIMSVGDLNEYAFVEPVQIIVRDGKMVDLMDAKLPVVERYSYNFDGQCQALDHAIVSSCLVRTAEIEPMHVNTWFPLSLSASDHDPEVALLNFC